MLAEAGLIGEREAAALLDRSVHTLRRARHDRPELHVPPCVRHGWRVFYAREAIAAFLTAGGLNRRKRRASHGKQ